MINEYYQPNRILLLEEVGEKSHRVHRMLTQLKMAGIFSGLSGVVLGRFSNCEDIENKAAPTIAEVFADVFKGLKIPVYSGLHFGHNGLNLAWPLMANAEVGNSGLELT